VVDFAVLRPQLHHLPPINIPSISYPDNGYEQDTVFKVIEHGATGVRVGVDIDPYSFV
jgi:hypothetical protein